MPNVINGTSTGSGGLITSGDDSGILNIQTNETTAMSISAAQLVTFTNSPTSTGAGAVSTNTAYGASALAVNTTGDKQVAIGTNALWSNTTGVNNTAVGREAMYKSVSGGNNTAVGINALHENTTASNNSAYGNSALFSNTTGALNTAIGDSALLSNTTASNSTAVGFAAGYTSTGQRNAFFGSEAGYSNTTGESNTYIGRQSGYSMTTGTNNTIIGKFSGNQGGLDIRTLSNKIVLSDGDGNPLAWCGGNGTYATTSTNGWVFGTGGTAATYDGAISLNGAAANGYGPVVLGYANSISRWSAGSNSFIKGSTTYNTYTVEAGGSGGVNLASGATAWASASDERLKDIIEPITDAATKVSTLRAVIGKYKTDSEGTRRPFLIAQDVQAVLPEAITEGRNSKEDETEYLQLAYTEVMPLLVAAIKEQQAIIETLTQRITALEGAE
jgi:hypothetical protein